MEIYRDKIHQLIPGGAHTYSRGDDQFPANAPPVLVKGNGACVWDPEGNKYLDYGMALRAVSLGYANRKINDAAIREIRNGNNLTRASITELKAAEVLIDLIPSADMVKFAKNGSSVTTAAVKLARAFTGKKMVARCIDHSFFSYDDWFIGDTVANRGIPEEISSMTTNFKYNDIESLRYLFEKYYGNVSCVIMEPATIQSPYDNYLQDVKKLCRENGALFILDEMITGFRFHLQGAQTMYGVEPDLSTFGKAMANGFSVAALTGRREIMELGGIKKAGEERVFLLSTTHGAEMGGLGAFIQVVEEYQNSNVIDHLWDYGKKLIEESNAVSSEMGLKDYFYIDGYPCSPVVVTKDNSGDVSSGLRTLFQQEMIKYKVLIPWIALSRAHGDSELNQTLEALREALKIYKMGLDKGFQRYLIGQPVKPVFRKFI